MAGALKVFVSYSHADDAYADQFVQALVSAGLDVWYDHQMLNGSGFAETIETELMSRPIFIVLLSKSSIGSQWVEREIQLALNLARRDPSRLIIPVMIEPVSEEQLPMMLTVLHRYDGSRTSPVRIAEMVLRGLGHAMPSDHPDSDAMITRGAALRASGNLAGALAILSDAVREASDSIVAWVTYGQALSEAGRHDEALSAADRALDLNAHNELALQLRADTLFALGRYDLAISTYNRLLALNPRFTSAWYNVGTALQAIGHKQEAAVTYKKLQTFDPDNSDAYMFEGDVLWQLGRREEAVISFERAIELKPDCLKDLTRPIRTLIRRYK